MKLYLKSIIITSCLALIAGVSVAGDLVYQPQNTAFGGTNANATQLLMSKAQTQDTTENPNKTTSTPQTAIERFQANLERRILTRLHVKSLAACFLVMREILVNLGHLVRMSFRLQSMMMILMSFLCLLRNFLPVVKLQWKFLSFK